MAVRIDCVLDAKARLGEGPCWDAARERLWWVDILACEIHCLDPATGRDSMFPAPAAPGSLAVHADGGLVIAMGDGFWLFDLASSRFTEIVAPEAGVPETRFNDGRTDRQGRFWAGSIHQGPGGEHRPLGGLYRLDLDGRCTRMLGDIAISNGLAWSPDGGTLYHSDSAAPFVWAWDYDIATGSIENRRLYIDLSEIDAVADGATVDAEGGYWVALPFKGRIHHYDSSGRLVQAIALPVDTPTCCEFGGAGLDILYVTSATFDRGRAALAGQPLAGGLFAIDTGVTGLANTPYRGRLAPIGGVKA